MIQLTVLTRCPSQGRLVSTEEVTPVSTKTMQNKPIFSLLKQNRKNKLQSTCCHVNLIGKADYFNIFILAF